MKIKIALPEELKGFNKYQAVYILNDEIKETMPATIENGYIVFETTHLSQYGIVATNTGSASDKATKSPKTGYSSNIAIWFAVLFASGTAVFGTTAYGRKKKCAE